MSEWRVAKVLEAEHAARVAWIDALLIEAFELGRAEGRKALLAELAAKPDPPPGG